MKYASTHELQAALQIFALNLTKIYSKIRILSLWEHALVDTFHLLFNAANMAEAALRLVWKQYQVFSDAAEVFLES